MTIFQEAIYKKIIEYHWFHYSNGDYNKGDRSFTISLSRVCWIFHHYISSLNTKFRGGYKKIDKLLKFHFQNPKKGTNKCAIYKEIVELHCEFGALRDVSLVHLKLIIPSIKILGCGSGDLDMLVKNGLKLNHLHIPISTAYPDEYGGVRKLLPSLTKLDIGVNVGDDLGDEFGDEDTFNVNPFIKFLFSAPFHYLTHLHIKDNDDCPYFSMFIFEEGVTPFFIGLTSMSSLQSLELSIQNGLDELDQYEDFVIMLVQYLKTQQTLKHFSLENEIGSGFDYLEFLLQKSSIQSLHIFIGYDVKLTRKISKLRVFCAERFISNLAMAESLSLRNCCSFSGFEALLKVTPSCLKVLNFTIEIQSTTNGVPNSCLDALNQNTTLERIYIDFKLFGQSAKLSCLAIAKSIDEVMKKHKTLRNTNNWFKKQQKQIKKEYYL